MASRPKDILQELVCFLAHSQLNQLSQCHPLTQPFTSRMRRWQPMKTALSHPQLFGPGSPNQGRLARAPDPVSGGGEPIIGAPAHLMHCGPLTGSRQTRAGADPHTGAVDPGHYSDCRPIRCTVSLSHVAWQTLGFGVWSCESIRMHVCNLSKSAPPFP